MNNKLIAFGLWAVSFAMPLSCALSKTTCEDSGGLTAADGNCTFPEGDGGSSSGGSSGVGDGGPVGCDPIAEPSCIDESRGVFVKLGAPAGGNGAKASPYPSIGLALADRQGKDFVYVCAGLYEENVAVTKSVSIIGGLDCTSFETGGGATRVSPVTGIPIIASGASAHVSLLDLDVEARAAVADPAAAKGSNGVSSIAAFIHSGAQVTAQRARFVTGSGAPGVNGADQDVAVSGNEGKAGGAAFGAGGASSCGVEGGRGGSGDSSDATSEHGKPEPEGVSVFGRRGCGKSEVPATAQCFGAGGAAGQGREGSGGAKGTASAATGFGLVDPSGWLPAVGTAGNPGAPGGGGGGGGQNDVGNAGGGGGSGGCGGLGGGGGGGGGASIGVLLRDASFSATASTIITTAAGNGGKGGKGGDGGIGGANGGQGGGIGQVGGVGGGGGGGGGGNGGAAGVQAGIVSMASTVTWRSVRIASTTIPLEGVTVGGAPSVPGPAGLGGAAGSSPAEESKGIAGDPGVAGADPVVAAVLQL